MGTIALFFCFGLWFICLRGDRAKGESISPALWLPVFWMCRVGSRAFGYWLGGGEGSWADPVILSALTLLGIVVLSQRMPQLRLFCHENRAFLLFFFFLSLSVIWTGDILVAFKRWIRLVGDVTMALIVLTEADPFSSLVCVIRRAMLLLIPLSLVLSLYFPAFGRIRDDVWTGVTVDKNWMGLLCFLSAAFLLWNWLMRRRGSKLASELRIAGLPFEGPFLGLTLYLLWGGGGGRESRSSTSLLLLAMAVGLFYLIGYARKRQIHAARLVTIAVTALLVFQIVPHLTGHRTLTEHVIEDVFHKDVNLTDRAEFWPLLMKKGQAHPWLGSGFGAFFTPEMIEELQSELAATETYFAPSQAHNGYIQIFLECGLVGLVLLAVAIGAAFKSIRSLLQQDFEFGRIRFVMLICALVSNWTEATFGRPNELMWFVFLLAAINPPPIVRAAPAESGKSDSLAGMPAYEGFSTNGL